MSDQMKSKSLDGHGCRNGRTTPDPYLYPSSDNNVRILDDAVKEIYMKNYGKTIILHR